MTGPDQPTSSDGQAGPAPRGRVSLEELADLDAGLLTAEEEDRLRDRIAHDPEAAEMLAALEQVHTDLAELPDLDDEPVPDDVMARLDAAIAAEADAGTEPGRGGSVNPQAADAAAPPVADDPDTAPVVDLAAARARGRTGPRRGRTASSWTRRWAVGVASVAAAAAVVAVGTGVIRGTQPPPPQPGSGPGEAITLSTAELAAQWPGITQVRDLGFLVAPGDLVSCLSSAGALPTSAMPAPDRQVLGARPVVVDNQYGVLVAVPQTPDDPASDVRLIVLGPHCDAGPDVIAETVVPR